jgi:hypothetical protein
MNKLVHNTRLWRNTAVAHGVVLWLILLGALPGCAGAGTPTPPLPDGPAEPALGDAFTLQVGQEVSISGENLHVRFDGVTEDSRCPAMVTCVWTGEARVVMKVWQDGEAPVTLDFNTNPAPSENRQALTYSSYTIRLDAVEPYPQTPDRPIAPDEYRVTLQVTLIPEEEKIDEHSE